MAKKNDVSNGTMDFGDISVIRNIIVGPLFSELERRFTELEEKVENLETLLDTKVATLEGQTKDMEKVFSKEIGKIEQTNLASVAKLDTKIVKENKESLRALGKMLEEMGRKLKEE